jgi:hypothetical protein
LPVKTYLVFAQFNTLHARGPLQAKLQVVVVRGTLTGSARAFGILDAIPLGSLGQIVFISISFKESVLNLVLLLDCLLKPRADLLELLLHLVVLLHQLLILQSQIFDDF